MPAGLNLFAILLPAFLAVFGLWLLLTGALLVHRLLRETRSRRALLARRRVREAFAPGTLELSPEVLAAARALPGRRVEAMAADSGLPGEEARPFAVVALERREGRLLRDASGATARSGRKPWPRIAALRILSRAGHPGAIPLLERALGDADRRVVSAAVAALGRIPRPEAADALIEALRRGSAPPSRIATQLESFPVPIPGRLLPLLADPLPQVRYWAAALLARYPRTPGLDAGLARLCEDEDPGVRKTAVRTLADVGGALAESCAAALLDDPVAYVRASAARSAGALRLAGSAERVAKLLADRDWWVRLAAKEALVALGPEGWPAVVRTLDSPDAFARNGAAEVLQNGGALAELMRRAAAGLLGDGERAVLRRAAASGGPGMVEGLLDGLPPAEASRLRSVALDPGPGPAEAVP